VDQKVSEDEEHFHHLLSVVETISECLRVVPGFIQECVDR